MAARPAHLQQKPQAQWGLFREDVRDVFSLSQSNMDNYILVGALIVSWLRGLRFRHRKHG